MSEDIDLKYSDFEEVLKTYSLTKFILDFSIFEMLENARLDEEITDNEFCYFYNFAAEARLNMYGRQMLKYLKKLWLKLESRPNSYNFNFTGIELTKLLRDFQYLINEQSLKLGNPFIIENLKQALHLRFENIPNSADINFNGIITFSTKVLEKNKSISEEIKNLITYCLLRSSNDSKSKVLNINNENSILKTSEPSHRMLAIIHHYKVIGKAAVSLSRKEQNKAGGKNREHAFDSLNVRSKTYKKITITELTKIIPYLSDYPDAQKAATNDLYKLENL